MLRQNFSFSTVVMASKTKNKFDGKTYDPDLDKDRLERQLKRVRLLMLDGRWRTLEAIAEKTSDPEASVSARLRDLRKTKFGGYTVERQRLDNGRFQYRLLT